VATNKVKTTKLFFPSFLFLDPGWKKSGSGINILHPHSTALVELISDFERKSGFYVNNSEHRRFLNNLTITNAFQPVLRICIGFHADPDVAFRSKRIQFLIHGSNDKKLRKITDNIFFYFCDQKFQFLFFLGPQPSKRTCSIFQ
jgi:hypothetical protein